jgi:hypothetical protein
MSKINPFKKIVLCSGDVRDDVYHLHIKRIHLKPLVSHLYIVREDAYEFTCWFQFKQNIIKIKMTILLDSLGAYMILILKNGYIRNMIMEQ